MRPFVLGLLLFVLGLAVAGASHAAPHSSHAPHGMTQATAAGPMADPVPTASGRIKSTLARCPPHSILHLTGVFAEADDDCPAAPDALDESPDVIRIDRAPVAAVVPFRSPYRAVVSVDLPSPAPRTLLRPPSLHG